MPGHSRKAENRRKYEEQTARLGRRVASGIPSGGPASGIPAHPGNRPPKGWDLTHGAHSERVYGPLAEELAAELRTARPDLDVPEFAAVVVAWSEAEARALLIRRHADEHPEVDPDTGEPAPFTGYADRIEARAAKLRAQLGITPASSARLARERATASIAAVDLADLARAGRQALDARDVRALETGADDTEGGQS